MKKKRVVILVTASLKRGRERGAVNGKTIDVRKNDIIDAVKSNPNKE